MSMITTRYFDQRDRFSAKQEVFTYDDLPPDFRHKVSYLLEDLFEDLGKWLRYPNEGFHERVWRTRLVRALGTANPPGSMTLHLTKSNVSDFFVGTEVFIESATITVNAIEYHKDEARDRILKAVDDLNKVLSYYGLGYEMIIRAGSDEPDVPLFQITRKDRQFTHSEIVKPALLLLNEPGFEHADSQFRDAHREFGQANYGDAITDADAAVESVLKVVLGVDDGNAKELLKKAADEGYFPPYMHDSINQWINLFLELPATRNRHGDAHGKGKSRPAEAEMRRLARLALNLAASHILFLLDEYHRRVAAPSES